MEGLHVRQRRGQNAILDNGVSITLSTLAVVALLATYYAYQSNSETQAQISQINALAAVTAELASTSPTTSSISTALVASAGNLPQVWLTGSNPNGQILSVTKTPIVIAPWISSGTFANGFFLQVAKTTTRTCVAMLTTTYDAGFQSWAVGSQFYTLASPPSAALAQAQCTSNATLVRLYFRPP